MDTLAVGRGDDDLVVAFGQLHLDQLVALVDVDGNDAALTDIAVAAQVGLLDDPLLGSHQEEAVLVVLTHADHGRNLLLVADVEQVDDGLAARDA